jgi:SAM-dependent methyltransferase
MKINLGCGKDIKEGWTNLDRTKGEGVDIVHDLNVYPYPIKDNSCDEIIAIAIMEHLDNPNNFIHELYRIGNVGCKIMIVVPHFSSWSTWGDITHKRGFNSTSLDSFDITKPAFSLLEDDCKFEVNKKIIFDNNQIFEWLFNLNNATRCFYERRLAYIFNAGAIEFILVKLKQ